MTIDDIKIGKCLIDNVPSFIRKVNRENETRLIICFHHGRMSGMICEDFEEFKKRKYERL